MTDEKVIEMVAQELLRYRFHSGLDYQEEITIDTARKAISSLLALRGDCPTCEGNQIVSDPYHISREYDDVGIPCPDCKGTGKGGKVLFTKEDIEQARKYHMTRILGLIKEAIKEPTDSAIATNITALIAHLEKQALKEGK